MLNDAYYKLLLEGRTVVDGLSILRPSWLILFKAKAWLDLKDRNEKGERISQGDINKHRNDIARIAAEMVLDECKTKGEVRTDITRFLDETDINDSLLHDLKIYGTKANEIKDRLRTIYL